MIDTIADLIIRIKNAQAVGKDRVVIPYSRFKESILDVMKREGYISNVEISDKSDQKKQITVHFGKKKISHIKKISKPGQRIYVKSRDIPRPLRGLGLVILSTPRGVISGDDARKHHVGGEVICEVW